MYVMFCINLLHFVDAGVHVWKLERNALKHSTQAKLDYNSFLNEEEERIV